MPTRRPSNGWREGRDPIQRWLRIVTVVVVLVVFVYLSVMLAMSEAGQINATELVVVIALALGAVLLMLGYEGVVKLPIIGKGKDDDDEQ